MFGQQREQEAELCGLHQFLKGIGEETELGESKVVHRGPYFTTLFLKHLVTALIVNDNSELEEG